MRLRVTACVCGVGLPLSFFAALRAAAQEPSPPPVGRVGLDGPLGVYGLPDPLPESPPPQPTPPAPAVGAKKGLAVDYGWMEQWKEGPYIVSLFGGGVKIIEGSRSIQADTLVAWSSEVTGQEPPARPGRVLFKEVDEVYAEGSVKIVEANRGTIDAEQVLVDFRKGEGIFLDFRLKTVQPKTQQTVLIRAEVARQVANDFFVAQPASVTSCTYGSPHYDVHARRLEFYRDPEGEGGVVGLDDMLLRLHGVPLGYWPAVTREIGEPLLLRHLSMGNTTHFGPSVFTKWGVTITRPQTDAEGQPILDKRGRPKRKTWGDLTWDLDYRSERGLAAGVGLDYAWRDDYIGFFDSYGLKDEGRNPHNDFDKAIEINSPLRHAYRGRAHAFHRQFLSEHWRLDTEAYYDSDRDFLLEYFPREHFGAKPPESYGFLRGLYDNWAFTLLQRNRINNWQSQTEYMPQASVIGVAQPVWGDALPNLYFFTTTELANVRGNFDDDLFDPPDSRRIWRFDNANELWYPVHLGPLNLAGFAGAREGVFQETLFDTDTQERFVGSVGARVEAQASRVYDVHWDALGIYGLRHIVSAEVRYADNYADTVPSRRLIPFDSVDAADRFQEIAWRLHQRLQMKVGPEDNRRTVDLLSLQVLLETYPNPARDTVDQRLQNNLPPFHWITLSPAQSTGLFEERRYSNLFWTATLDPQWGFQVIMNGEYNTQDRHPDVLNTTVGIQPLSNLSLGVGHYSVNRISDQVRLYVTFRPVPRLTFILMDAHDFVLERETERRIGAQWDLHDVYLEWLVHVDTFRHEEQFLIGITPKFFGRQRSILSGDPSDRSNWSGSGKGGGY